MLIALDLDKINWFCDHIADIMHKEDGDLTGQASVFVGELLSIKAFLMQYGEGPPPALQALHDAITSVLNEWSLTDEVLQFEAHKSHDVEDLLQLPDVSPGTGPVSGSFTPEPLPVADGTGFPGRVPVSAGSEEEL